MRVWRDKCQTINRADAGAQWSLGTEPPQPIPLREEFKGLRDGDAMDRSPLLLALALGKLEDDPKGKEAKELIHGRLAFEKVMSTL